MFTNTVNTLHRRIFNTQELCEKVLLLPHFSIKYTKSRLHAATNYVCASVLGQHTTRTHARFDEQLADDDDPTGG